MDFFDVDTKSTQTKMHKHTQSSFKN